MLDSLFILIQMISLSVLLTWALREDSKDVSDSPSSRTARRRRRR